jgi:hypothetical protein
MYVSPVMNIRSNGKEKSVLLKVNSHFASSSVCLSATAKQTSNVRTSHSVAVHDRYNKTTQAKVSFFFVLSWWKIQAARFPINAETHAKQESIIKMKKKDTDKLNGFILIHSERKCEILHTERGKNSKMRVTRHYVI